MPDHVEQLEYVEQAYHAVCLAGLGRSGPIAQCHLSQKARSIEAQLLRFPLLLSAGCRLFEKLKGPRSFG